MGKPFEFDGPYVLEHGDVWIRESASSSLSNGALRHVCSGSEELAVARDGDVLLKVGPAASIDRWFEKNREAIVKVSEISAFFGNEGGVEVFRFQATPETIQEMNACIAITGRVARIHERLAQLGAAAPTSALVP